MKTAVSRKGNAVKIGLGDRGRLLGEWIFEIRDMTGRLVRTLRKTNIIPTVALNAVSAQFGNDAITKDIGDNFYIAVGDDVTAPLAGDVALGNETARKAISDRNADGGNVASISAFFSSGEATGTHREFGLFGDGDTTGATAAADSGILYSHVSANVAVAAAENLTVTFNLTITT